MCLMLSYIRAKESGHIFKGRVVKTISISSIELLQVGCVVNGRATTVDRLRLNPLPRGNVGAWAQQTENGNNSRS